MIKVTINKIPKEAMITKAEITKIAQETLDEFGFDKRIIEILFVDKSSIHELNLGHRQVDKPTDVLSFPQMPIKTPGYSILGSLVICIDMVIEKQENIVDVIKHGLLHLLDFDHETDEAKWNTAANKINCNL